MKLHYVLAAGAAALLLLAGCESGVSQVPEEGKAEPVSLWFEQIGGPSTKVDIDGDTGFGSWTEGDQIAIYVAGTGANFYQIKPVENIEAAPDNNTGHSMVSLAAGQTRANYAIYPATSRVDDNYSDATGLYIKYPAEYDYSKLTVAQMATYSPTPMVAINDPATSDDLNFYHVGGVLRLTIPGVPQSAYSLRITFPESFKMSGTFQVVDGGTANATLTDAGLDDHSNVINIKVPVLETAIQDIVLNIPVPCGDYTTAVRDFKIEVRTERIAYMASDGIVNFASVLRAQGKKQIVPTVETLGTMGEIYLSRGYLLRSNNSTVNPADMSFEDAIRLSWYKSDNSRIYSKKLYFSYIELGKIMTGDSTYDGSTTFEDAQLTIDGIKYRVPSMNEWKKIIDGERPGSIVNGQSNVRWAIVRVPLTTLGLTDPVNNSNAVGVLLFPDGGVFDCSTITNYNSNTASNISYAQYRMLTDGPNRCAFLVYSGFINNSGTWCFTSSWNLEHVWSCTPAGSDNAYIIANHNPVNTSAKTSFLPVRLVRVEE